MPSPTRRTLHFLRNSFRFVDIAEYWNAHCGRRKDLFTCIDIVALGSKQIIGVQCTSGSCHSARREKILRTPAMKAWIEAGGALWLISWSKKGPRGQRKVWVENLEMFSIEDFNSEANSNSAANQDGDGRTPTR